MTDVALSDGEVAPLVQSLSALPGVRVLVLAAEQAPVVIRRLLNAGALGWASKTETSAEILRRVRDVAAGQPSLCPEALRAMFHSPLPVLTARQMEVLSLMDLGLSRKQVARRLALTEAGVKSHLQAVYTELNVSSARAALSAARTLGIFQANTG